MKPSLQRYLTLNSLIIVILSAMLAVTATFVLRQDAARQHLDAELSLEAHLIESMLSHRLTSRTIKHIQFKMNRLSHHPHHDHSQTALLSAISQRSQFQVWDLNHQTLILHSPGAPNLPHNPKTGHYTVHFDTSLWRAYSIVLPQTHYKIVTFKRHDHKLHYEKQFLSDTLMVLAITFSFLTLSLHLVIKSGLSTLRDTKQQLEKREPSNLNPIDLDETPLELQPMVKELNRLMAQLKSALEREHQFAANAAHELKTPLSTIKAQIQLALMKPLSEQKAAFEAVEASIDQYDHIIRQLLTLSRTVSQATLKAPKPIALVPLIQNTIATLVPFALKREITLEFIYDLKPVLHINETLITTALQNLIDNAIKYTYPKDTIEVHLYQDKKSIIIDVIDHGIGIADKDKSTALQRFQRLPSNTQGSGLGLSIISEICKQLQGTLSLRDTPSGGLTASLSLPVD